MKYEDLEEFEPEEPRSLVGNAHWSTNDKRKAFRLNKQGLCPREIALAVNRSEAGVKRLLRSNGHTFNIDPTKSIEKRRKAIAAAKEKEEVDRIAAIESALASKKEAKPYERPQLEHNPYLLIL